MKNTDIYYEKSTGRILYTVAGSPGTRNTVDSSVGWISGATADDETQWVDDGEIKDRPTIDVTAPALAAGEVWDLTLPIGTEIAVVAEDGVTESTQTTDEATVEIAFEDAGVWTLRLTPPFPYQPAKVKVEVAE